MYTFVFSPKTNLTIVSVPEKTISLAKNLSELADNPLARAKKTNIPFIGEYYINSGNFCVLFDINSDKLEIIVYGVVRREYLYKILTGRIGLIGN